MNTTSRRTKFVAFVGAGAASAGLALTLGVALPAHATPPNADGEHKITLCHATNSYSNPYVVITVDVASVLNGAGHAGHTGPVFSPDLPKHTDWGDIIPAFDYGPGEQYGGMNLDGNGQATLDNGCQFTIATTTTTTTVFVNPGQ